METGTMNERIRIYEPKAGICQAICNDFLIFFLPKFTLGSFFLSFSYFRS